MMPCTNILTGSILLRLENWRFEEWGDQVTVVSCDMREWAAPEKADIIVSELLGSFGDNELSPECLDGAQHFLKGTTQLCFNAFFGFVFFTFKESTTYPDAVVAESLFATSNMWKSICQPLLTAMLPCLSNHFLFSCFSSCHSDDGVSIPCSYTSFLAPLSSSKLYNEVRGCRERDKDPECHFETPYVVRLHNFHQLAEPKPCFTFRHPTKGRDKHSELGVCHETSTLHVLTECFWMSWSQFFFFQIWTITGISASSSQWAVTLCSMGLLATLRPHCTKMSHSVSHFYKEEVTLCYNWIYVLMIVCVCVCVWQV